MKNLHVVLLALFVLAVSQVLDARFTHLRTGTQYTYRYYGHYLSKLDSVGNTHTGFALKAKVIIQVKSQELTIFKLEDIQTAMFNDDLYQVDEEVIPWQFQEGSGPLTTHLLLPARVHWREGRVTSLEVSSVLCVEAINILKAIVAQFQLSLHHIPSHLPAPLSEAAYPYSSSNSLLSRSDGIINDVHAFKVLEDGIGGKCKILYAVQSNPSPYHPTSEVFNITKYPNYHECEDPPIWARSTHVPNQCADCDADDQHPLAVVSTIEYDIRKKGDELTIETIEAEAQTRFAPYSTRVDHLVSNHSQVFKLMKKEEIFTHIPPVTDPKTIPSLKFTFPTSERARAAGLQDSLKKPMVPFLSDEKGNIVEKATVLLLEIVKEIEEQSSNRHLEDTPLKVLRLVKLVRRMNKDEISQFYNGAGSTITQPLRTTPMLPTPLLQQVYLDVLVMSGSYPAIIKLKYLIESRVVVGEKAVQLIQAMPTNVFEPSEAIVQEIWGISRSTVGKEHSQVHKTAVLATAILIGKACDGPQGDVPSLPTAPHIDTLCPVELERKYIQQLAQGLHNSRTRGFKLLYLRALGLTGSPMAIIPLRPYAEGIAREDEILQVAALRSLTAIAKSSPEVVNDIAEGEFYDTDNPRSVRIAALRAILAAKPDLADLEKIAAWYDKEPSDDLKGYIFQTFDVLSNTTHYCMKDLANNAEQLMAYLDEDDDNGITGSTLWESSQIFDELGISTRAVLSSTASNSSVIPEAVTAKVNISVAGFSVSPLKVGIQARGLQTILNRILGPSGAINNIRSIEDLFTPESHAQDKRRTPINGKLKLDTRTDDDFFFSAFLKLGDTQARMVAIDYKDVINYANSAFPRKLTINALREGIPINYNKLALPLEVQVQIPSILGVPTVLKVASIVILRLQGKVSIKLDPLVPLEGVEVSADIRPSMSSRLELRLGVYNPFKKVISSVAVGTSTYIAPPISARLDLNILKGKVDFQLKPNTEAFHSVTNTPKIFQHKVKPYSMHKSLASVPAGEVIQDYKVIHSDLEPDVIEIDLSERLLGLPLVLKAKSEHDWTDQPSFVSDLKEYDGVIPFALTYQVSSEFDYRTYEIFLQGEGAEGKAIQLLGEWKYVPSPSESLVLESMKSRRGFLPVITGFATLPQPCSRKEPREESTDDDDWYYYRKALKLSKNIDENEDETEYEDYNEDPENSSYRPFYYSRLIVNKTLKPLLKSPWQYTAERPRQHSFGALLRTGSSLGSLFITGGSPSISNLSRSGDISEYHLRLKAFGYGENTTKLGLEFVLKRDQIALTDVFHLRLEAENSPLILAPLLKICTTASVKYPIVPCDYHSLMSPRAGRPIHADISVTWGETCAENHGITMKVKVEKSQEQQRVESEKAEWYFKQCQIDIASGKKWTDACQTAQLAFSSLNKLTVLIKWDKLGGWLRNLTAHVDTYLKTTYYPQMTNNPVGVNNEPGHLKIVGVLVDEVPSVNLFIYKPTENTFFRKIFADEISPYIYSISTRESLLAQFIDDITDGDATPSCEVMGKSINTFDNSTFKHHLCGCQHVIVKDCTPDDLFAVTMADTGSNMKKMKVYVLSHEIVILPKGRYTGEFEVVIDGHRVHPTNENVIVLKASEEEAKGTVIALIVLTGPKITVQSPTLGFSVVFDGEDASAQITPLWASRVCGLCGEYDGESNNDFRGPRQCLYGDAFSFSMSYGLPSDTCQLPSPGNTNKLCPDRTLYDYSASRSIFDPLISRARQFKERLTDKLHRSELGQAFRRDADNYY